MPNPNYAQQGMVARSLAFAKRLLDGGPSDITGPRTGRYQEPFVLLPVPFECLLCDEGALMTATMLPGATTLQLGISASFSATAAAIAFQNTAPVGPLSPRCHLRFIRLVSAVVPTSGTNLQYATVLDSINRTPTTISGLGAPGTPATVTAYLSPAFCTNMDEKPQIVGQCYFPLSTAGGAPPTVPAASQNARTIVGNGLLRAQIPVVNDDYRIVFAQTDAPAGQLVTAAPNAASRIVEPHPAVVVGPQEWFLLYLWSSSNITAGNAFSEVEVGWFER